MIDKLRVDEDVEVFNKGAAMGWTAGFLAAVRWCNDTDRKLDVPKPENPFEASR